MSNKHYSQRQCMRLALLASAFLGMMYFSPVLAQDDYLQMSLEELMNVPVTSVSKSESTLSQSAAAVYVITGEDIRHSGATTVPELLRAVPGMDVAQMNGNRWAVSSRGFNYAFANKLLVLIDGRTIYSPVFSGVFWEELNLMLDDIERIEVIRGPGAAIWGANAVNGVINIITKDTKDTIGGLASTSAGTLERTVDQVRYGGELGEDSQYRLYGRYYNRGPLENDSNDSGEGYLAGFRMDSAVTKDDSLMLQTSANWMSGEQTFVRNYVVEALRDEIDLSDKAEHFYALSRWTHNFSADSRSELLFYYDYNQRDYAGVNAELHTFDFEAQHEYQTTDWMKVIYGASYRGVMDSFVASEQMQLGFPDSEKYVAISSAFLHSELSLLPQELILTLGAKVEDNTYTGFEWEPNLRLSYLASNNHTFWAASSRAVRMPARINDGLQYNLGALGFDQTTGLATEPELNGNPDFRSENLAAYELGYRGLLTDEVSLDLALFYNRYGDVETIEPAGMPYLSPRGTLIVPASYANLRDAETWGVETALTFAFSRSVRLRASHSFFEMHIYTDPASQNIGDTVAEGIDPDNQVKAQLSVDLPHNIEWDVQMAYVSALPFIDLDRYVRFDSRLATRLRPDLTLSLVMQNLLDDGHYEFSTNSGLYSEASSIPRAGYLKLDYRF